MYRKYIHTLRKLKQKFDANGNLSAVTRLANAIIVASRRNRWAIYVYTRTRTTLQQSPSVAYTAARIYIYPMYIRAANRTNKGEGKETVWKYKEKNCIEIRFDNPITQLKTPRGLFIIIYNIIIRDTQKLGACHHRTRIRVHIEIYNKPSAQFRIYICCVHCTTVPSTVRCI